MAKSQAQGARGPADSANQGKAQEVASQAIEKVQEQTLNMREQARDKARAQLDTHSTTAGEQVGQVATALRRTGDQLDGEGNSTGAKVVQKAADKAEAVGSYLRDSDADRFLNDVESFARRRPWAAAGVGAVLGLVASRFLKASSENRYDSTRRSALDSSYPMTRGVYDEHLYSETGAYPAEPAYGGADFTVASGYPERRDGEGGDR